MILLHPRYLVGGWKSGRIKEILVSLICVWLGVKKWRDEKLIYLVEKKNGRIENEVCLNLLLCPYFIICKKYFSHTGFTYQKKKKLFFVIMHASLNVPRFRGEKH